MSILRAWHVNAKYRLQYTRPEVNWERADQDSVQLLPWNLSSSAKDKAKVSCVSLVRRTPKRNRLNQSHAIIDPHYLRTQHALPRTITTTSHKQRHPIYLSSFEMGTTVLRCSKSFLRWGLLFYSKSTARFQQVNAYWINQVKQLQSAVCNTQLQQVTACRRNESKESISYDSRYHSSHQLRQDICEISPLDATTLNISSFCCFITGNIMACIIVQTSNALIGCQITEFEQPHKDVLILVSQIQLSTYMPKSLYMSFNLICIRFTEHKTDRLPSSLITKDDRSDQVAKHIVTITALWMLQK